MQTPLQCLVLLILLPGAADTYLGHTFFLRCFHIETNNLVFVPKKRSPENQGCYVSQESLLFMWGYASETSQGGAYVRARVTFEALITLPKRSMKHKCL